MYIRLRLLLCSFILCLIGLPSTLFADEVTLESGQSFGLRIAGVPAEDAALLRGEFSISDSGLIELPYLQVGIEAAGLKPPVLAREIEEVYNRAHIYTAPTVQIDVGLQPKEWFVSLLGEVRTPQPLDYTPGMTLIGPIAQCGGCTDFAKTKKIKLTRVGKDTCHDLSRGARRKTSNCSRPISSQSARGIAG